MLHEIPYAGAESEFTSVASLRNNKDYIININVPYPGTEWLPSDTCKTKGWDCGTGSCCVSPSDPNPKAHGSCYSVDSCDDLSDPQTYHGLTYGYDLTTGKELFAWNTSECWHGAVDPEDDNTFFCLTEDCDPAGGGYNCTNRIEALDLTTGETTTLGHYPPNFVIGMNDAAFNPDNRRFYALVAPGPPPAGEKMPDCLFCGLRVDDGDVSCSNVTYLMAIDNIDYDPKTKHFFSVFAQMNATDPAYDTQRFGVLNVDDQFVAFSPVSTESLTPYEDIGYNQINQGYMVSDLGVYLMGAFKIDQTGYGTLFIVGTDVDTGEIILELRRPGRGYTANFADMEWIDFDPTPSQTSERVRAWNVMRRPM